MKKEIAIVDYGMGNLHSVSKAFVHLGYEPQITDSAEVVGNASHIVLPGVGAFRDAVAHLKEKGLVEAISEAVRDDRPFLGICLGLQLLFDSSEEFGSHEGLGLVKGKVVRFPGDMVDPLNPGGNSLKVPHLGWNRISKKQDTPILAGIDDGSYFYFVHSYYVAPSDDAVVATMTDYGIDFTSSIGFGKCFACQFHPEKSQKAGLKLLDNFARL
jgi:imidazole glycerol-phosphate synthase subunit HisH